MEEYPYVAIGPSETLSVNVHRRNFDVAVIVAVVIGGLVLLIVLFLLINYVVGLNRIKKPPPPTPPNTLLKIDRLGEVHRINFKPTEVKVPPGSLGVYSILPFQSDHFHTVLAKGKEIYTHLSGTRLELPVNWDGPIYVMYWSNNED